MDLQEAFDAGFDAVKKYVDDAFDVFESRLLALEARKPEKGDPGKDGPSDDQVREIAAQVAHDAVQERMAGFPPMPKGDPGKDGVGIKGAEIGEGGHLVLTLTDDSQVQLGVVVGKPGTDAPDAAAVAAMVDKAVSELPPAKNGEPGKDADEEVITAKIMDAVMAKFAAIPVPKNGEPGKDGVGLAGAVIDRDGGLIVTLTDGTQKSLGRVVGQDGKAADPGRDGADGLGFDDLSIEFDGDRSFKFVMVRGDVRKEFGPFTAAWPLDRGVFKEGMECKAGDGVTYGGHYWFAKSDTTSKPDSGDGTWRMAVRKGRDGKDGVMKPPADKGPVKL